MRTKKNFCLVFLLLFCSVPSFAQLKNIGTAINSEYSELNPIVSNGSKRLYFVVTNHPSNYKAATKKPTQDIWYSDKDSTGVWGKRVHMSYPINSFLINSVETTDPSGNILILRGATVNGKYKERAFSYSYHTKEGWSAPQKITIGDYTESDKGSFSGLTLCPNMKAIIISFSADPQQTKQDLYIAFREGLTTFSKPVPLSRLNTEFDESTPYIASDNRTLYFTSDRTGSLGQQDIYMSKRVGDSWDSWTIPVNIGPAINTDRFDSYYSIDPSNKLAYIVRSENTMGKEDIFIAPIDKQFQPENVYIVNGRILDGLTLKPLNGEIVYHDLNTNTEQGRGITENNIGTCTIFLEKNYAYGIEATAKNHIGLSYYVDTNEMDSTHTEILDLYLFPIQKGTTIPLDNLFFKTSSAAILPTSTIELNRITKLLLEYPTMHLKITGYTDNTGNDVINKKLSADRAAEVKKYLVDKGFAETRFITEGLGTTHPAALNTTTQGRTKNRRVEITITQIVE